MSGGLAVCEGQNKDKCRMTEYELYIVKLQSKLDIAMKALKKINQEPDEICGGCNLKGDIARKAIADIEAIK